MPQILLTGEELARMPGTGRTELVDGRLVDYGPADMKHGLVMSEFASVLEEFVSPRTLGKIAIGGVGLYTRHNPDTVRAADVMFISYERLAKLGPSHFLDPAPELIVDVLSPDDRWSEVRQKLREYFEVGVRLVWVADPEERSIHVFRSPTDVRVLTEGDTLSGEDVLPGFEVEVGRLFG